MNRVENGDMVLMKRTNRFNIEWDDPEEARDLAIGCSTLWNKLNYKRRESFFDEDEEFDWSSDELYDEFKSWVSRGLHPSILASAAEIVRRHSR